jgi:ATP-dependent helicase YprA (DUF1998 family)
VFFDDVPGGAGHARFLAGHVEEFLLSGVQVVADCECGEETSCYSCLRTYSNQWIHDDLSRAAALDFLHGFQEDGSGGPMTAPDAETEASSGLTV